MLPVAVYFVGQCNSPKDLENEDRPTVNLHFPASWSGV